MTDKTPPKVRLAGGPYVSQEMSDELHTRAEENGTSLGIELEHDNRKAKAFDKLMKLVKSL